MPVATDPARDPAPVLVPPTSAEIRAAAGRLRDLMGRLRRRMNAQLPDGAPSLSEIAVLGYLHRLGPASQVQLAALHNVRPQSMGATVNEMVEAGLITREVDVADRRKSVIHLTPEGQRQINRLLRSRQDWLAQAMASQLDGAEQRTLVDAIEMLERLLDS